MFALNSLASEFSWQRLVTGLPRAWEVSVQFFLWLHSTPRFSPAALDLWWVTHVVWLIWDSVSEDENWACRTMQGSQVRGWLLSGETDAVWVRRKGVFAPSPTLESLFVLWFWVQATLLILCFGIQPWEALFNVADGWRQANLVPMFYSSCLPWRESPN